MNSVMQVLLNRKSIRAYEDRDIGTEIKTAVLKAAMRAPTAGNLMLYSIIEVEDPGIRSALVKTCDNQVFIAEAPWVLLFVADYQRWYDCFVASGIPGLCREKGLTMRKPEEGDIMLACCDALIAAHTAVIAAESLGLGSCYIGDITEHYEAHRGLFDLPPFVIPICLVCFGYPTRQEQERKPTLRFDRKFIVSKDRYRRLKAEDFEEMCRERQHDFAHFVYLNKFEAGYARERNRSVRAILSNFKVAAE